jgi:hypothetical protein
MNCRLQHMHLQPEGAGRRPQVSLDPPRDWRLACHWPGVGCASQIRFRLSRRLRRSSRQAACNGRCGRRWTSAVTRSNREPSDTRLSRVKTVCFVLGSEQYEQPGSERTAIVLNIPGSAQPRRRRLRDATVAGRTVQCDERAVLRVAGIRFLWLCVCFARGHNNAHL